jgi:hypothetical protein
VADDRSLAAGEDGGHPASVPAEAAVANGVDAAVDAVEAATSHVTAGLLRPTVASCFAVITPCC